MLSRASEGSRKLWSCHACVTVHTADVHVWREAAEQRPAPAEALHSTAKSGMPQHPDCACQGT
jgi:Zn-finger protein